MQQRSVFAGPYLDRDAQMREDAAHFAAAMADAASFAVPVWNSRNLITTDDPRRAAMPGLADLPEEVRDGGELILLGRFNQRSCFACALAGETPPQIVPGAHFEDLRGIAPLLQAEEAGLLGYARAMVAWQLRHRYCGSCGTATRPARSGHTRICNNAACAAEQFPRIDPAIIVLVSDGERALLGRQASWPAGRYSTIAGFVEPGESLEDAVAREVLEETGVPVDRIEYQSSQPWPFPASLMLGFTARAVGTTIVRRDQELEDAGWFSRADLAAQKVMLPPRQSISFALIEQWFDAGGSRRLRDIGDERPWR